MEESEKPQAAETSPDNVHAELAVPEDPDKKEPRRSVRNNLHIKSQLTVRKTSTLKKQDKKSRIRFIIDTVVIIVSFALTVLLAANRTECTDEFVVEYYTPVVVFAIIFASAMKAGVLVLKFTRFSRENIAAENHEYMKSFASVFYSLHLMPLILVDTECEEINPMFGHLFSSLIII
jgi:hypothetical protein